MMEEEEVLEKNQRSSRGKEMKYENSSCAGSKSGVDSDGYGSKIQHKTKKENFFNEGDCEAVDKHKVSCLHMRIHIFVPEHVNVYASIRRVEREQQR